MNKNAFRILIVLLVTALVQPPMALSGVFNKDGKGDILKTHPHRWAHPLWVILPSVAAIGTLMANPPESLDSEIRSLAQRNRSSALDGTADAVATFGSYAGVSALGVGYAVGAWRKDEVLKKTMRLSAYSALTSYVASLMLKGAFGRSRPDYTEGQRSDDFSHRATRGWKFGSGAFPSGHTAFSFSIAAVLARRTSFRKSAYGVAALVGVSRIIQNKHWASDVVGGAMVGYFSGRAVLALSERKSGGRLTLLPVISGDRAEMILVLRY